MLFVEDIERLSKNYLLSETDVSHVHRLQSELEDFGRICIRINFGTRGIILSHIHYLKNVWKTYKQL